MRVIIEGADGAGKSTLAKALGEHYGLRVIHLKGSDPMDYTFCHELYRMDNVIFDRSFWSEKVYSKFYNLPSRLSEFETKKLILEIEDFTVIVCKPKQYKVMENEDSDIQLNHKQIEKHYDEFYKNYPVKFKFVDPFKMSVEDIIKLIEG